MIVQRSHNMFFTPGFRDTSAFGHADSPWYNLSNGQSSSASIRAVLQRKNLALK